jgi:hypothetical protein
MCYLGNKLPPAEVLRDIIENMLGYTYPPKTLHRRIGFLTKKEKASCDKLFKQMEDLCQDIDDIISYRAEIKRDKWP